MSFFFYWLLLHHQFPHPYPLCMDKLVLAHSSLNEIVFIASFHHMAMAFYG